MTIEIDTTTVTTSEETEVATVSWDEFRSHFVWGQGEHVGLIGPTGSGKTHLATWLLPMRRYIIIFATKPKDSTLDNFGKHLGFKKLPKWEDISIKRFPRRIIWPDARKLDSVATQKAVFTNALNNVFIQGGWTLYIDELWYTVDTLQMKKDIKVILQQARSMKISLVVSSQRPAWIPVEVYDQSTHLFFWRDSDITNLRRIGGIGQRDARLIIKIVMDLPKYHVLYLNTRTGKLLITKPPAGEY